MTRGSLFGNNNEGSAELVNAISKQSILPSYYAALRRPSSKDVGSRKYLRIQLPSTRASSRSNDRVMTDSLKIYEEQIFSHEILSGQRPMSWCIDVASTREEDNSSGSASVTNSSSTISSVCSSSSSSNVSHVLPSRSPKLTNLHRSSHVACNPSFVRRPSDLGSHSPDPKCSKLSQALSDLSVNEKLVSSSNKFAGAFAKSHIPSGKSQIQKHVILQTNCSHIPSFQSSANEFDDSTQTSDASTPNGDDSSSDRHLRVDDILAASSCSSTNSFSSSLATVRLFPLDNAEHAETSFSSSEPMTLGSTIAPCTTRLESISMISSVSSILSTFPPFSGDASLTGSTDSNSTEDNELLSASLNNFSIVPPPHPWNINANSEPLPSNVNQLKRYASRSDDFSGHLNKCVYCHSAQCYCGIEITNKAQMGYSESETETDEMCDEDGEDDESTYAFSTLDSDFISWMRLSVKDITTTTAHHSIRQSESLACLTRQDLTKIVNVFNTNSTGLHMEMDGDLRLMGTMRVYINLIKPVKMSLRETLRHMPLQETPSMSNGTHENAPVPEKLISFFLPRGGSRVLQLTESSSTQEVIQSLLERFHIQESAGKFSLYEHTLETETIFSRKLLPSERPLSMLLNWVRSALDSGEEFATFIRKKRIVLQENECCEINWNDFTAAELTNFLRILEKEEAEYRNAIYFQYGLIRQQIERRMATLCAQKRVQTSWCKSKVAHDEERLTHFNDIGQEKEDILSTRF